MSNQMHMMIFDLRGSAELIVPEARIQTSRRPDTSSQGSQPSKEQPQKASSPDARHAMEQEIISALNDRAETIAEKIERELKKIMPPQISAQAHVQFEAGSILMTGTVALISWAGSVVVDAAKEELQSQLASLVKTAIQRVINRVLSGDGLFDSMTAMQMDVTPQPSSAGSLFVPGSSSQPRTPQNPLGSRGLLIALVVVTGLIFSTQLIVLLDHFFVITPRP